MEYVAVLDVESMGLYGRAFSYGIIIGDTKGNILEKIYKYSENDYELAHEEAYEFNRVNDIEWVEANITPHVGKSNIVQLTESFYLDWVNLKVTKYPGITLYDGVSIELSSGNLWIKTLWGVDVYVDPEQKEPFKIIKGESNAKKQTSFTCSKSFI